MIGQTVSYYKIVAKLGEGGMGVVYKAEDTKLQRAVALKFLPINLTSEAEARQRFLNEARAASALNHPNICTIHSVEDADEQPFIVMEFVEGQTLSEIIRGASLAVSHILAIASQIVEGLNQAHSKNITHRDLKPDNVMVTAEGLVKVMDFGLAKMKDQSKLTKSGSTLGTAAYMSPEQAQAREVDGRSDIFSFGAVLYEMTTGQRAFVGEYEAAIAYAIVNENPPPPAKLRQDLPADLERIILRCLEKEREDRYQSAAHLLADLKKLRKNLESGRSATHAVQPSAKARKRIPKSVLIAAALVLTVAISVIGYGLFPKEISTPKIVKARALTTTTAVQEFNPQISPDGTKVLYYSYEEGKGKLWVRQIASEQKINLTKDEKDAIGFYAWSPDGNWIAFASARNGGGICLISEYGGVARRIVAQRFEDPGRLNWSPDGKKLVYIMKGKLYTVLASGGVPEHIPLPYEVRDPAWSPDGERIVLILGSTAFGAASSSADALIKSEIWTIRPDGSEAIPVFAGPGGLFSPTWANDGKRIFFKYNPAGTRDLWWVPVEKNGKPTGSARPLTAGLNTYDFSLSSDGSKLTYATGRRNVNIWSLPLGVDRLLTLNDALQITDEDQEILHLAMSPDHKWLAFMSSRLDGQRNMWLMREDGQNLRQLTADSSHNFYPSWSPDGSRIAFSSDQGGNMDIYMIPADGGPATALTAHSAKDEYPSWSPDGKEIVFHSNRSGNFDLWTISVRGGETTQLTGDQADDTYPLYSPDGRFISFLSNRKGTWDLYLLPTGGGEPRQLTHVSATRIMGHVWSPDGKTIYYNSGRGDPAKKIWAVSVDDGSIRKILDFKDDSVSWLSQSMATDGKRLFFIVGQPLGDIWLAELTYE